MPIEAGKRYIFINKQSGTALDLDTRDKKSVQGWARHGRPNQQWEVIKRPGDNWQLKNVQQGTFLGRSAGMEDGDRIVCTTGVYNWLILPDRDSGGNVYRIIAAASSKCVDLADHGNSANGTPVQIWTVSRRSDNQKWDAQEV